MTPDTDIVTYLAANVTEQSLVAGTNIFAATPKAVLGSVPELAVFVYPFGGGEPERYHSCTVARHESYLTVETRGQKEATTADAYGNVLDLAREMIQLLTSDGEPVIAGYLDIYPTESDVALSRDDEDRPVASFSVVAERFE